MERERDASATFEGARINNVNAFLIVMKSRRMASIEPKYRIRSILLIIGYILLCVGGVFFIYLILLENTSSTTEFGFMRIVVWTIGLTIAGIGFIGLLLIFKLLDYSSKKKGRQSLSVLAYNGDFRCPKCNFLVTAEDAKTYRNICPDCKTDWRIYPLKKETEAS